MKIFQISIFALIYAAFIAGCATSGQDDAGQTKILIGCWKGSDYQPLLGKTVNWQMERRIDGTFSVEFAQPSIPNQIEAGLLSVNGNKYTTITLSIDGKELFRKYTDVYELRDVTENSMSYFHQEMKLNFHSKRVPCTVSPNNSFNRTNTSRLRPPVFAG